MAISSVTTSPGAAASSFPSATNVGLADRLKADARAIAVPTLSDITQLIHRAEPLGPAEFYDLGQTLTGVIGRLPDKDSRGIARESVKMALSVKGRERMKTLEACAYAWTFEGGAEGISPQNLARLFLPTEGDFHQPPTQAWERELLVNFVSRRCIPGPYCTNKNLRTVQNAQMPFENRQILLAVRDDRLTQGFVDSVIRAGDSFLATNGTGRAA